MKNKIGLLGSSLSHSYSKEIHESLGKYEYHLFDLNKEGAIRFLKERDFSGINITIPYKKLALDYCDKITPLAKKIGAINTLYQSSDGGFIGDNTDYGGFLFTLKLSNIDVCGKTCGIIGSGGASSMINIALKDLGASKVSTVSREAVPTYKDDGRPENLISYDDFYKLRDSIDIIINATPVGTYPNLEDSPISLEKFKNCQGVVDLIYNPQKTKLIIDSEALKIPCSNGLPMLVHQALASASLFDNGVSFSENIVFDTYKSLDKEKINIILIGMPGCGKTSIGKTLSLKLNRPFIDTDIEIEKIEGMSIKNIFEIHGESYFRELETQVIKDISRNKGQVISLGGGSLLSPKNLAFLKAQGHFIFIDRPIEKLSMKNRPLSKDIKTLKAMYQSRYNVYNSSKDFKVDNNTSIDDAIRNILNYWRKI